MCCIPSRKIPDHPPEDYAGSAGACLRGGWRASKRLGEVLANKEVEEDFAGRAAGPNNVERHLPRLIDDAHAVAADLAGYLEVAQKLGSCTEARITTLRLSSSRSG